MTPDRLTRPSVGLIPTMPQHVDGETIEPSVSVPIATAQRLAATATPEPELDPDGVRSRVGVRFEHRAQGRSLAVQLIDPLEIGGHERARGVLARLEARLQRGNGDLLELERRGELPGGPTDPGRKPGEPPGRGQHHAAHCGMLEKHAAVHRPIAHGGLLVEMTGWGNGAKLAATRDSRPAMQQIIGGQSDVGKLRRIAVKHARDAFGDAAAVDRQWRDLRYLARPDVTAAWAEYEHFLALLEAAGVDPLRLPPDDTVGLDSLYARDVSIVCDQGVILCNMGKPQRRTEPAAQEAAFRAAGIPIRGRITGDGTVEGGDVCWIDERTLAVGRGYRTNDAGIRQLRDLVQDCVDEVVVVPLPHWHGPEDVFHLMSIVSPIDRDLFLVYSPLMPVPFREALISRGIELLEIPDAEFATLGCNVLAVAPREVLMVAGNLETRARLERAGVTVHEFAAREICPKGGGGPTCLTRPLTRDRG